VIKKRPSEETHFVFQVGNPEKHRAAKALFGWLIVVSFIGLWVVFSKYWFKYSPPTQFWKTPFWQAIFMPLLGALLCAAITSGIVFIFTFGRIQLPLIAFDALIYFYDLLFRRLFISLKKALILGTICIAVSVYPFIGIFEQVVGPYKYYEAPLPYPHSPIATSNSNNHPYWWSDVPVTRPSSVRIGAVCWDGTSSSATGSGACSWHGGVRRWTYK
jgi:hypothetical protein